MRHNPYVIDDEARDAWLRSMRRALDRTIVEQGLDPAWEQELWRYLVGAAIAMVNQMPPEQPGIPVQDAQEPPR
jgi:hemoglobin